MVWVWGRGYKGDRSTMLVVGEDHGTTVVGAFWPSAKRRFELFVVDV